MSALQVSGIRAGLTIRKGVGGGTNQGGYSRSKFTHSRRESLQNKRKQPIQSDDIPTQKVRDCGWLLFAFDFQNTASLGQAPCRFQLHPRKQPPKCKTVYCASAERISPHHSCSASAAQCQKVQLWVPAGNPIQKMRREESACLNTLTNLSPLPPSGKLSLRTLMRVFLFLFFLPGCCCHRPQRAGRVSEGIRAPLPLFSLLSSLSRFFQRPFRGSRNLNILLESKTAKGGVSGSVLHIKTLAGAFRSWRSFFYIWGRTNKN